MAESQRKPRRAVRIAIGIIAAILVIAIAYIVYVFASYSRLDDALALAPEGTAEQVAPAAGTKTLVSFNIGMGIYNSEFGFFMDGGNQSRATSADDVLANTNGVLELAAAQNPDFINLQEVAIACTCNYGIDQSTAAQQAFSGYDAIKAQNWDSPYLFYPFTKPFGKAKCCLMTLSRYTMTGGERRSLPIDDSLKKFLDLDRCYAINRVPLDNGRELVLINLHLSAYTDDETVATNQIKILLADMQKEIDAGNYVIATGDFNKDLLGNSASYFGVPDPGIDWAKPFPTELVPASMRLLVPFDATNPVPSARNADGPYNPQTQFCLTVDGAIVSSNVNVESVSVLDAGFANTDHNPVKLVFSLA